MPNHVHGIIEIVTNVGAKYFSPENDEHWTKDILPENDGHWTKDISPQPMKKSNK